MMKTLKRALFFSLTLLIGSCIEPWALRLDENDTKPLLVVEGLITNKPGPFSVKLTTSEPANIIGTPQWVLGADVQISDDKGNLFQLMEDKYGVYETAEKDIQAIPGNTYTLHIHTKDGEQYESSPVLMLETPDIDSVYFEEVKRTWIAGGQGYEDNWMNILLDTHDPQNKLKYWRFEFEETWEVHKEDYVVVNHSPSIPSPANAERVDVAVEKVCWVTRPSGSIIVTTTANDPVDEIKRFPIRSLGPGEDKLYIRYSILVKQSSINQELYDFWKQLKETNENTGGIYDHIPGQVFGNITYRNGTARALGYFSASCIKEKRLFINYTEHHITAVSPYKDCSYWDYIPENVPIADYGKTTDDATPIYTGGSFCGDCTYYGSNVKPDFWK